MKSKKLISEKISLDELIFGALSQLQILGYHDRSIRRYQSTWKRLITFAKKKGFEDRINQKLMIDFLAHHNIKSDVPVNKLKGWKKYAEFNLRILWNYARFGYFEHCRTARESLNIPAAMKEILHEYKKYCEEKRYLSPHTVTQYIRQIDLFLDFLYKRNIEEFNQLQSKDISDFICSLSYYGYSKRTISHMASYIRVFLKFLFLQGKLQNDLSTVVPSISFARDSKIPSVWDRESIVKLLDVVDRSSPRGKRDYAILLLACRLGLRVGDIRELTLDHLNWETETISIIQAKTKNSLSLPLTNEIGNALIDYIKFGRPETKDRHIFLRLNKPFIPFSDHYSFHNIVSFWRKLAGIKFLKKQHTGLHSLRHSLATHLLEDDIPFPVIADILGHASTNTTMIYAKSSIEMLRQVSLSINEVNYVK